MSDDLMTGVSPEMRDALSFVMRRIANLEGTVRGVARQSGAAFQSVETGDGGVVFYDDDGNVLATTDGTGTTVVQTVDGPPTPTDPDVAGVYDALVISYDGTFTDGDWVDNQVDHVEIHATALDTDTLDDTNQIGTFTSPNGGTFTYPWHALDGGRWIWLQAVTTAGEEGTPSNPVFQVPDVVAPTDGVPPATSPAVVLKGGIKSVVASWTPTPNNDPVWYDVYLRKNLDPTSDAIYLIATTPGTSIVLNQYVGGAVMQPTSVAHVMVVARDADGEGPDGAIATASPILIETVDITGAAITNGTVAPSAIATANIQASAITNALLAAGAVATANVQADAITSALIANGTITTGDIGSAQITNLLMAANSIATGNLQNLSVTAAQIANDTITAAQIAASAVTSSELAANAVTTTAILAGAVTATQIAASTITNAQIATDTILAGNIAANAITSSEIAADAVTATAILNGAVTTLKVANTAITAAQIALLTITAAQVANDTITATQIATNGVTATEIATDAVTTPKLIAGAVTAAKITADTITANEIAASAITTSELAALSVTAGKIVADTITANEIAANAITTSELAALSVTAAKIVADTITANEIAANAITTSELNALSVTAAKIVSGTITTTQIAATTIVAGNIVSGTLTTTQIAASTITGGNIAATTITAANIAANTITATQIFANTITAGQIAAGTITATQIAAGTIVGSLIAAATITGGLIAAGTILAGNIAAGTITGTQIAAGTLTANKLSVIIGGGNMLDNSSFEDSTLPGIAMAGAAGTGTFATSVTQAFHGVRSLKISATVTGENRWAGKTLTWTVPTGSLITVSGWVWVESYTGAPTSDQFLVVCNRANNTVIAPIVSLSQAAGAALIGKWTRFQTTATTTDNGVTLRFMTPNGVVYWDNVQVEQGDVATSYSPKADEILPGTVVATMVATDTLLATNIAADAITTSEIAANTILAGDIAANTITAAQIAANTITAAQIAATTITAAQIAATTITAAQIAAGTITATQIAAGTITAGLLSATAIDGKTITGAIFQTAASGNRLSLSNQGLADFIRFYGDGTEVAPAKIIGRGSSTSGLLEFDGLQTTATIPPIIAMNSETSLGASNDSITQTATKIFLNGRVVWGGRQPQALRSKLNNQTIATGAGLTDIIAATDTGTIDVTTPDDTIFTVHTNGIYIISAIVTWDSTTATGKREARIAVNNSAVAIDSIPGSTVFNPQNSVVWVGRMAAGDNYRVKVSQTSGGNLATIGTSNGGMTMVSCVQVAN